MGGVSKEELEEILTRALGSPPKPTIPAAMHDTHHKYVQLQIEKDERRKQRLEKMNQSFLGTLAASAVAGIIWLGQFLFNHGGHN